MKKVLILCTGNSCRSIMAEGMINKLLAEDLNLPVYSYSSGVKASGKVNPNAKKILENNQAWKEEYHSKVLDEVIDLEFDLIVTVCDHAKETCPIFPKQAPKIHVGFKDPDGSDFQEFVDLWEEMKVRLIPEVRAKLEI